MKHAQIVRLMQDAKNNTYTPHGSIDSVDCVIGFSFGYVDSATGIKPGKSNQQLARFIEQYFPAAPLILQFEIDDALRSGQSAHVVRESRNKGKYLNSREIAEQARLFMQQCGWQTAAIVTHPAMEARNDALCKKLGISTVAPPGLATIAYDAESAQPWTRDKQSWWKREKLVILRCAANGWI